jgi:anaerobic selenocysteine-containing dehydrogenase
LPADHTNSNILCDTAELPCFVTSDTLIGSTSMYANYIFPNLSYLKRWDFREGRVRQFPLDPETADGLRSSLETIGLMTIVRASLAHLGGPSKRRKALDLFPAISSTHNEKGRSNRKWT